MAAVVTREIFEKRSVSAKVCFLFVAVLLFTVGSFTLVKGRNQVNSANHNYAKAYNYGYDRVVSSYSPVLVKVNAVNLQHDDGVSSISSPLENKDGSFYNVLVVLDKKSISVSSSTACLTPGVSVGSSTMLYVSSILPSAPPVFSNAIACVDGVVSSVSSDSLTSFSPKISHTSPIFIGILIPVAVVVCFLGLWSLVCAFSKKVRVVTS